MSQPEFDVRLVEGQNFTLAEIYEMLTRQRFLDWYAEGGKFD